MSAAAFLSVVIPTHNRAPTLRRCLAALLAQAPDAPGTEIIVVDDGSEDGTRTVVDRVRRQGGLPVEYVAQPPSGPAAARNRGLRHARGDLVLFLGDDIIAAPGLLREHLAWHARFPETAVAVLGLVTWSPEVRVTPYMRWLETSGNQFDYDRLRGLEDADPGRFLYTANLSFKREVFFATGTFFDERFRHALLEDIDLGRRLAARGLRLKYNAQAIGYHEHAVTLASYARRMELSSEYWLMLERKREAGEYEPPGAGSTGQAAPPVGRSVGASRPRRDYVAYAGYLAHVSREVVSNFPFWLAARYFERRAIAPIAFTRAHRYWTQRGLLRVEAKRAWRRFRGARGGDVTLPSGAPR